VPYSMKLQGGSEYRLVGFGVTVERPVETAT